MLADACYNAWHSKLWSCADRRLSLTPITGPYDNTSLSLSAAGCDQLCGLQMVGPILAEPAKPLPQDLDAFLQQGIAQGLGAVYVSMGSAARLSEEALLSMAQGLSALPSPVLWKLSQRDLPGVSFAVAIAFGMLPV